MSIPVAQAVLRPLGSAIRASDHRRQSRPTLLGSVSEQMVNGTGVIRFGCCGEWRWAELGLEEKLRRLGASWVLVWKVVSGGGVQWENDEWHSIEGCGIEVEWGLLL